MEKRVLRSMGVSHPHVTVTPRALKPVPVTIVVIVMRDGKGVVALIPSITDVAKRIRVFLNRVLFMARALRSMVYSILVHVIRVTRLRTLAKLALPSTIVY